MLALELQMRGLIVNIYPVMIGDIKLGNDNIYGNYFKDGCHPSFGADDVYVKNNQSALEGHLDRLGLGTPMLDDLSVSKTVKEITKNQGLFVEGNIRSCLQKLSTHVASMRKDIDSMVAAASQSAVKSTRKQSLQVTSSDSFSKVVPPSLSSSLPSHKVVPLPQLANASATSTQAPVNFPDVYSIKVTSEDIPIEVNPIVQISSPTSPASQPISPLKTQKNSKKTKSSKVKSNDGNMLGSEDNQQPTGSPLKEVYGEQRDAVQLKYTSPESESRKDQYMQSTQDYSSAREPSSYSFNPTDSYNSDPRRRHPPSPRNMIYLDDNTKRYGYSDNTHSRNQYNDRIPFDQNPISRTLPVRQELYPPAPYYGNNSGYDNYGRRYDESQSPYSPNPAPHMPLRHYTPHQQDSYNNTYVPSRGDPARPHSPSAQDYPSSRPYGRDTQSGASNDSRFQSADDEARYRRGEPRRKH